MKTDIMDIGLKWAYVLIAVLVAVFMVTRLDLISTAPQVRSFIITVLSNGALYDGSPWWTYFTSMWLHSGFFHLFSNIIGFYWLISTWQVALVTNRIWFTIYVTGGLFSGAVHILIHHNEAVDFTNWVAPLVSIYWRPNTPLVGASGAIFAVWGATVSAAFRYLLLSREGVKNPMTAGFWILFILATSQFAMDPLIPGVAGTAHLVAFWFGCVAGFFPTLRIKDSLVTNNFKGIEFLGADVRRIYIPPFVRRKQVDEVTIGISADVFDDKTDSVGILSVRIDWRGRTETTYLPIHGRQVPEMPLYELADAQNINQAWISWKEEQKPVTS